MNILITSLLMSKLMYYVQGDCSFTQHCTFPPYVCNPPYHLPNYPPFQANWTSPPACPMYIGQKVCCNDDQNQAMLFKYSLIDSTFGHGVGGCDICAANMKYMWCEFTCSPDQARFVSSGPQAVVPSPATGQPLQVMLVNYTVTSSFSCEIYTSCKKCPYVTMVLSLIHI